MKRKRCLKDVDTRQRYVHYGSPILNCNFYPIDHPLYLNPNFCSCAIRLALLTMLFLEGLFWREKTSLCPLSPSRMMLLAWKAYLNTAPDPEQRDSFEYCAPLKKTSLSCNVSYQPRAAFWLHLILSHQCSISPGPFHLKCSSNQTQACFETAKAQPTQRLK
eukprot:1156463-Pelagomonas_calceolata.AAC.4